MNAMLTSTAPEPWLLREEPPRYGNPDPPPRIRVALFGSFYGGFHVLRELLSPPLAEHVVVSGVANDDPSQAFTHAALRLWKYPHSLAEEEIVALLAEARDLPVFRGRVTTPEFQRMFVQEWAPDLCLMATFGQMIPRRIFAVPPLGFYNFHHCGDTWPSYPGPDPIRDMVRDGRDHVVITMHEVSEVLDGGRFVARSHPVPLPKDANATIVHRLTWPQMGPFIREHVLRLVGARSTLAL